mgnify:CR=1 FL=1
MDVNNIQNNINNLNNVQQQNLDKTAASQGAKQVTNDEALNLTISQVYQKQRDELSQSLQNLNEGIAVTEIAKKGLQSQENSLKDIQQELYNVLTDDAANPNPTKIKDDLAQHLKNFNDIADSTSFQNKQILTKNDQEEAFTISTKTETFSIEPIETKEITSELIQNIHNNPLSTNTNFNKGIEDVQQAINKINEFSNEFNEVQTQIKNSARETITDQVNLSQENAKRVVDFGQETSDFSKTNITANAGYFVGSQANIVQEQSIRLLAK